MPEDEKTKYDDVNLYHHSLSDVFANVSLRGKALTAENTERLSDKDAAGDLATSGVAPKAWVRRKGAIYSQKAAALTAVRQVGLNQKKEIRMEWLSPAGRAKMFAARLELLKKEDNGR